MWGERQRSGANQSKELTAHIRVYGAPGSAVGLRHCATSRKVAGSIPDGVIGIFH